MTLGGGANRKCQFCDRYKTTVWRIQSTGACAPCTGAPPGRARLCPGFEGPGRDAAAGGITVRLLGL